MSRKSPDKSGGKTPRVGDQAEVLALHRQEIKRRLAAPDLASWCLSRLVLRGTPFSFAGHAYLRELYSHPAPNVVIRKAAQMGGSTYALARSLYTAGMGYRGIYYLPTDGEAQLYRKDRLQDWVRSSPALAESLVLSGDVCRVGSGTLLVRGLATEMRARAVDADFIVLDELDCLSPARRNQALDRTLHSTLCHTIELSTPKLPGMGIDARFQQSDMRHWLIKCPACGREEPLESDFPACLSPKDGEYGIVCPRCGGVLDVQQGRWVAEKPDNDALRGYHFSQLQSTVISLSRVWEEWEAISRPYERERFYNSVLGLPYAGDGRSLTTREVEACMNEKHGSPVGARWAGVDVGDVLHVALCLPMPDSGLEVCWLARLRDWQELRSLLATGGIQTVVIDAMPYKASAKRLARDMPAGMVHLAYYGGQGRWMGHEEDVPTIRCDRTELLDELVALVREGRMRLPGQSEEAWRGARHLLGLWRTEERDREGRLRAVYPRGGEDHYAHALAYCLLGRWITPAEQESDVRYGGERNFPPR